MKYKIKSTAFVMLSFIVGCNNQIDTHPNLPNSKTLKIVSIQPTSIMIGDIVTINGTGFDSTQNYSIVTFNTINASEYMEWSVNQIKVKVPNGTTSGKLSVTVNGIKSNEVDFTINSTVVAPQIFSIQPTSIKIGDILTIYGANFGTSQSSNFVSFNSLQATEYLSWSDANISVKVPTGATTGKLSVTSNNFKSNEVDFTIIPTVIAPKILSILPTSAKIGDLITISGTDFGSSQGSNYVSFNPIHVTEYLSWSENSIKVKVPTGAISGQVSVTVSSMKSNEVGFIISSPENYESVKIGNQIWMLKNLNVDHYRNGDPIQNITNPMTFVNLYTGAWCYYNNDQSNGVIYGKLYNWYAVNDPRGLAPEGWHVPSSFEWEMLSLYLGTEAAGSKLKENNTSHWMNPNIATNESGFTALPGGFLRFNYNFYDIGRIAAFWTSSEYESTQAWRIELMNSTQTLGRANHGKGNGCSVRCVRD